MNILVKHSNQECIRKCYLQGFLHQWHNHLGPSGSHGNVWTLTWSERDKQRACKVCTDCLCLTMSFAAVLCRCSAGVYPLRSCRVVTASEHPSLPGRSNMLPQSGCLSKRTSASVRDTGRKHLQATHTHTHTSIMHTHTKGAAVHPLNTPPVRTHGGISPTKGTESGEGGARVGVRVLLLHLSLSTTSFSICSWPGSRVRQDGTFSCDWKREENIHGRNTAKSENARENDGVVQKMNIYIYNGVEETFPQLPWFQVRCLEKTKSSFTPCRQCWLNLCVSELSRITVSLVSPSFMRRMSLAASRFLSRLQSSFRDTNPPRSSFSTYCNTRHVSAQCNAPKHRMQAAHSGTYMSILGIIEEIQWIPTQTGPQPPGCLSHTYINRHENMENHCCGHNIL